MPTLFRLDPDVVAKGIASLIGTVLIGGAKWVWEDAKRRGRKAEKVPAYLRVEQLEAALALATTENFNLRNNWEDMRATHRERQRRTLDGRHAAESRAKAAEGRSRAAQMDVIDLKDEVRRLNATIERLENERQRPDQA